MLIAATSGTADELEQANELHRQVEAAPVTGRASREPLPKRDLLSGIRPRAHLVNVTHIQLSGTSSLAGAALSVTGGAHTLKPM